MKKLLIVAVLIIGIIALCGCENKVETVDGTPKLYGHAEYAIERVGQAEGLTGGAATKLPIADSEVYLVIFGDRAFIYEYGVSEDGTVDDTWAEQELRW